MECRMCGRQIQNENANFCEYCGESLRENKHLDYQDHEVNRMRYQNRVEVENENDPPISFGNWLGSTLLLFIPIPFLGLFFLLKWALGKKVPINKKNWAKAMLVIYLLGLLFMIWIMNSSEFNEAYNILYK